MVTFAVNSFMNTIVMALYWQQNRKYFNGISFWLIALSMQTVGFLLLGIRGTLPDFITIVVSNFIIVAGSFVLLEGLKQFVGNKTRNTHNYILLALYLILQYYFTYVQPSTSIRIIIISILTSLIFFQAGWLLLHKKNTMREITKAAGIVCYLYILAQMYRAAVEIIIPTSDYFNASFYANLGQVFNQFLTIAIVFSLIIMGNSFNLYNRLKVEEKLVESKDRIEYLYNNAPCGYHSIDKDSIIISMNDTELKWLGYSREEVIGKLKLSEIGTATSAEKIGLLFPKLIETGYVNDTRVELLTKTGEEFPVIANSKAVYDNEGRFLYSLTSVIDRKDVNRSEKELHEARKRADDANDAKSDFLSKMSHELRTPLNSIITLSGVLSRSLIGKISVEEHSYLGVIARSGQNLLEIINEILDISRIESGRVDVNFQFVDLNDIIADMINVMQPLAMEKNIELIYRRSDNAICIFSDDEKIKHIMQNLVSNAIKFTDNGYVEISTTQKESRVAISVSDTGIGMEESSLLYIFDEFRQVDNTTSRRYGGTGLGLAIVKEYLELLGGSISVKSTLGKGSIFTIEIPLNTCQGDTKEQDL